MGDPKSTDADSLRSTLGPTAIWTRLRDPQDSVAETYELCDFVLRRGDRQAIELAVERDPFTTPRCSSARRPRSWSRRAWRGCTLVLPGRQPRRTRCSSIATPSERLTAALVAIGDVAVIVRRVREHLDAGADHVCVEMLTGDGVTVPMAAWTEPAPALREIERT